MKSSLTCPKCQGRKLWHFPKVCTENGRLPLPLCVLGSGGMDVGHLEAFSCAACGYTEWYAYDLPDADLERRIRKEQEHPSYRIGCKIELIDNTGKDPGPYR